HDKSRRLIPTCHGTGSYAAEPSRTDRRSRASRHGADASRPKSATAQVRRIANHAGRYSKWRESDQLKFAELGRLIAKSLTDDAILGSQIRPVAGPACVRQFRREVRRVRRAGESRFLICPRSEFPAPRSA